MHFCDTFGSREKSLRGRSSIAALRFVKRQTVISRPCHHLHVLLGLRRTRERPRAVDASGVGVRHVQLPRHRIRGQVVSVSGVVALVETYKQ